LTVTGTVVVLDDDPTGTQAVAGVPVLFAWPPGRIAKLAAGAARPVHLMTNSRALEPSDARRVVADAAGAALSQLDGPLIVLRGDSTLRAHVLEEYLGVCDARADGARPVLLLVPALPHAGRLTRGGVQVLERGGRQIPLHHTEYARDGGFAYRDARLLQWAHDRSGGFFERAAGREVAAFEVGDALIELGERGRPAVCVPDVGGTADLHAVHRGLRSAIAAGTDVIVRAGPAFAAVVGGRPATERVSAPRASAGVAVICGSHVPTSTRQLATLVANRPGSLVATDLDGLTSSDPRPEIERAARAAETALARTGLAIIATPRTRRTLTVSAGSRLASNLARVLSGLDLPDVVIAKGGITSHVTARVGLGADMAEVVGPVAEGVALWRVTRPNGHSLAYLVVPGNVGGDELLARLVDDIMPRRC
jgi:uncharacterized protein YgbK (DUF1537 family)